MLIERIFKLFIPLKIERDTVQYSYAKNIVGACIISIIASPFYALMYYLLNFSLAAQVILLNEVFLLSTLLIIKYLRSVQIAHLIFVCSLTILLFWLTYSLGGIYSATAYWLILPPLVAAFVGGMAFAYFWCVVSICLISLLMVLQFFHYTFPQSPVSNHLFLHYIAICGLNLVIIPLVHFYEMGKKSNLEKLQYMAFHDSLTGLPNRLAYEMRIGNLIGAGNKQKPFAILYIDIDHFHTINAIFGRHTGDALLKEIAGRIKKYIRLTDVMARVGGNEFKIVIENDVDSVNGLADIIFMALKIPFHIKNEKINITASIGIVQYPFSCKKIASIDRCTDIALSKAKRSGGNSLQHFTESLAQEDLYQIELETYLSEAIKNNELKLYFQPRFQTYDSTKITGLEALLRWDNPTLGEISPSIFIPIAEKTGSIFEIGEWVLTEACKQYVIWLRKNLVDKDIPLAVNISVQQLYNDKFLTFVEELIKSVGIPPHFLEFEITETTIITDLSRALIQLEFFKKLGLNLVIDDFGSGYTSLSYLDTLPVSLLKIDKSFLGQLLRNEKSYIVLDSIIDLAHRINLLVVVEGIETLEHLNHLRELNCDYVQGFYLSKPLDSESIEKLLAVNLKRYS